MNTYTDDFKPQLPDKRRFPAINKFRMLAVLIHLAVSTLLVCTVCAAALLLWFPYPLFLLDGTWVALLTLGGVDLALGPLITLIISSDKKSIKELFFDFSVVLCIQLAALSFGLLKIYDQRVVALVHVDSEFHIVPAAVLPKQEKDNSLPVFGGIRYGMLLHEDFKGMLRKEIELTIYSPENYRTPKLVVIEKALVPLEFIPESVLQKYGDKALYKLVIGKKRHGIAVINTDMQMLDIVLAENAKDD